MIKKIQSFLRFFKKASRRFFYRKPYKPPFFKGNDFGFSRGTPIDRVYIENFIKENCQFINGNVLEFGDNYYYRKFCNDIHSNCEIFTSELDNGINGVNRIYGDITKTEELKTEAYDTVICTNVLNFIFDINSAVNGLYKMLKPGGNCLITLAGYSTHLSKYDSERWGDYWRLSEKSAIKLFDSLFIIKNSYVFGNAYASVAQMYGYCLEDLDSKKIFKKESEYTMIVCLLITKPI